MGRGLGLRFAAAAIAIAAWSAEVLFVAEQMADGGALGPVLWNTSAYLTDWTVLSVAIVCSIIALRGIASVAPFWRAAATMGTLTVGILFAGIGGLDVILAQGTSSLLAHLIIPLAMALLWLTLPRGGLRWAHALAMTGLVALYLGVMFTRGALTGFYPYPFMDAGKIGLGASLGFAAVMAGASLAVSFALVWFDRWRAART